MPAAGKKQSHAPQHQKHVPQRTCVACRATDAKRALIRLVRTDTGRVDIDRSGKRNGRGAYLCLQPACWDLALKRRMIQRALRVDELHADDQAALLGFVRSLVHNDDL